MGGGTPAWIFKMFFECGNKKKPSGCSSPTWHRDFLSTEERGQVRMCQEQSKWHSREQALLVFDPRQ